MNGHRAASKHSPHEIKKHSGAYWRPLTFHQSILRSGRSIHADFLVEHLSTAPSVYELIRNVTNRGRGYSEQPLRFIRRAAVKGRKRKSLDGTGPNPDLQADHDMVGRSSCRVPCNRMDFSRLDKETLDQG